VPRSMPTTFSATMFRPADAATARGTAALVRSARTFPENELTPTALRPATPLDRRPPRTTAGAAVAEALRTPWAFILCRLREGVGALLRNVNDEGVGVMCRVCRREASLQRARFFLSQERRSRGNPNISPSTNQRDVALYFSRDCLKLLASAEKALPDDGYTKIHAVK
jgi:hypothetical protein